MTAPRISGHHAPPPRLTAPGAALVALAVALPAGALLQLAAWAWP